MSGLFSIFSVATRGMDVQQRAIAVTSHNIANANTEGYSRQRAIMETTRPFGMPTVNSVAEPGQIGTGAQITAIQRVRDNFLDYQVRVETSTQGQYQARDKFLSEVENIFNEPSDTGLSTLMGKFFDSWQQLSKQASNSNARTVVAQQSAALADELNHTYTQLQKLKGDTQSVIKDNVFQMNDMLNQINQLNQQIIGVQVAGNNPNDLMDKRDLLLDQLSAKFNINIDKKNFSGIDLKPIDESGLANPYLVKAAPNDTYERFSYISSITRDSSDPTKCTVTYYKLGDMSSDKNKMTITLTGVDDTAFKQLDEGRVLWANSDGVAIGNDGNPIANNATIAYQDSTATPPVTNIKLFQPSAGELKGDMSVQKDIDDYIDQLNKMAKALAFSVNAVHSGMSSATNTTGTPAKDYVPFFVNSDKAQYDAVNKNKLTNVDDVLQAEQDITAGNISVNKELISDPMKIKTRTHDDQFAYESDNTIDGETDGARALSIAQLRDSLLLVQNIDSGSKREDLVKTLADDGSGVKTITNDANGMTLDNYFKDTVDRLGVQEQEAQRMVKNQQSLLDSFQQSKDSISSVSIDEEMANLIQFQHAYQANAKIVSTIDQLLDVVVNGLKR